MDQALLALMKQLSAEEKLMFQSDYEDQKKSTVLAVVLALLLGGFGAHWFYLGRCLLYTSPSPRDYAASRMPSSA